MTRRLAGPVLNESDVSTRAWYDELPVAYDADYFHRMHDFDEIVTNLTNEWTEIKDGSASTVTVIADTQHGRLGMISQATTNDSGTSIQQNEIYAPTLGKRMWFECKLQSSDADQQEWFVGICENFASDPEACLTSSNRIGFQVDDGDASILCITEATDVENSTNSQIDCVDATDITVGFQIIGLTTVRYFVNRLLVATHTATIPTALMTLAAYQLSGDTSGTKSLSIDYFQTIVQR